jgi:hypothetical protein
MGLSIEVDATGGLDMLRNLGDGIPMGMDRALELIARRGEDIVQDKPAVVVAEPDGGSTSPASALSRPGRRGRSTTAV